MKKLSANKYGLVLTAAGHLLLLWLILARHTSTRAPHAEVGPAMTWLLPVRTVPRVQSPPAPAPVRSDNARRPRLPPPQSVAAGTRPAITPAAGAAARVPAETSPASEATVPNTEPVIGDLSLQPAAAPISAAELLRLTLHDAGKIDNELRGGKLAPLPPPGQTIRGKIDAAFEAAHQAVRPKWYEAAKVNEISSPNSGIRVYKIRTALGTYCISMADPGMHGGGGAPRYTNCP